MTTNTTFEPCNQCGNDALLPEGNGGRCLSCLPTTLTPEEQAQHERDYNRYLDDTQQSYDLNVL